MQLIPNSTGEVAMPGGPPEAFGIDALTREVRRMRTDVVRSIEAMSAPIETRLQAVEAGICGLLERLERNQAAVMAGVQELTDALNELDTTITAEVDQINQKLDDLRNQVAPNLQPQVDQIKASTERIKGIVADVVPEPAPQSGRK